MTAGPSTRSARSAARIERDIATLSAPPYTADGPGITRHAFSPEYQATVGYFVTALGELGFESTFDAVGNLVAANRPAGEPCFGLGSHCDSVPEGGAFDGALGMACALEVCRLARDEGLDLPLRVVSFVEEEGAGFGQMLLGSRAAAGALTPDELEGFADASGTLFVEAARVAGYDRVRCADPTATLGELLGWIELHIEQARLLETEGRRLGIVDSIAGYVHADIGIHGRRDHAGATPMAIRTDAGITAAEIVLELERLARSSSDDTVATVGELALRPGAINVIPEIAQLSVDTRSVSGDHERVAEAIAVFAQRQAAQRGQRAVVSERQRVAPMTLDDDVVAALEQAAERTGEPWRRMHSAAAHDTMMVARRVPAAMVFVPCRDGVSHSPDEHADAADAALAAEVILAAVRSLAAGPTMRSTP